MSRRAYWSRASGLGYWATTPKVATLNKLFVIFFKGKILTKTSFKIVDFDQLFRNAHKIKTRTLTTALLCHIRRCYTRQFFVELDSQRLKKLWLSVLMLCAPVFIFIVQLLSSFSAPTLWFIDLTVFVVVVVVVVFSRENGQNTKMLVWANQKMPDKLLSRYVTLGNFWCNLRRNKTARQVRWKIVWCNKAFRSARMDKRQSDPPENDLLITNT